MGRITETVKTLLIINVVFYVATYFIAPRIGFDLFNLLVMWFPELPYFKFWQIITHMFMHASGLSHIGFNMFNLYMFGSILENHLGKHNFLFLYFSSGLGALLLYLVFQYMDFLPIYESLYQQGLSENEIINIMNSKNQLPGRMLGASGAVSGLFMAFAVLFPNLPLSILFIPVPIKAKYLIGGYFLMDLYFAITGKSMFSGVSIAHWAHVGGALIGFIIIWYWKKNSFNDKRWY